MKKIVEVTEVSGEGLDSLLGEQVLLFGMNYIYSGKLAGINDKFVQLEGAKIVYDPSGMSNCLQSSPTDKESRTR